MPSGDGKAHRRKDIHMKYKRIWFFGGTSKSNKTPTDWIDGYKADNGTYIKACGFGNHIWYEIGKKGFNTLKEAKAYCERRI